MFRSRKKNKLYQRERASKSGLCLNGQAFKSGLEEITAKQLFDKGIRYGYEAVTIPYTISHTYRPDFNLLDNGIIIETKGFFEAEDRSKMRYVKLQHPALDIRFVFSNAHARIAKKSKTTYAMWAEKQGFKWAHRTVPEGWLTEAANKSSLAAIKSLQTPE